MSLYTLYFSFKAFITRKKKVVNSLCLIHGPTRSYFWLAIHSELGWKTLIAPSDIQMILNHEKYRDTPEGWYAEMTYRLEKKNV